MTSVLVSANPLKVPPFISNVVVKSHFNSADDYIVEKIQENDLLTTADIELADRALKKKAFVMDFKGIEFTDDNIGSFKASRELMGILRDTPFESEKKIKPRTNKNTSDFANNLNNLIQKIIRKTEKEYLKKNNEKSNEGK